MSIELKNVSYVYQAGLPMESRALQDVNISINEGEFIGIAGTTGSGKSTLIQHLNGLLKPTEGQVLIDGMDIHAKKEKKLLKAARLQVGMVFQYPEYQLFEETVEADIGFGPKNLGLSETEVKARVKEAMQLMQLDYKQFAKMSPFDLSGGQKRKVAIAGVLAMKPKYLVFDEPTAGLDPVGKKEFLQLIQKLHRNGQTIIMISHNMDDHLQYAKRMLVLDKGRIIMDDTPQRVFQKHEKMMELGLGLPTVTELMLRLKQQGLAVDTDVFHIEDAKREILRALAEREKENNGR